MRIAEESLRVRTEIERLTPSEWELIDAVGPDASNPKKTPFRLLLKVRPQTDRFKVRERTLAAKMSDALTAQRIGGDVGFKHLRKTTQKALKRTPGEQRAQQQRWHDIVREELLVDMRQVFDTGETVPLEPEEIEESFRVPQPSETRYASVKDGSAGYAADDMGLESDDANEQLLRSLEKGEALCDALVRLVTHLSREAERQRTERDEEEVFAPLADIAGSGPGSSRTMIESDSSPKSSPFAKAGNAASAATSGSPADATPARATIA